MDATLATGATFQINNAKLYVPLVFFSINNNMKLLENMKQGLRRTTNWDKYRSEIATKTENNRLYYLIGPTFLIFNRLFVLSLKNGDDDQTKNCFDKYYMPLVKIKDLMH